MKLILQNALLSLLAVLPAGSAFTMAPRHTFSTLCSPLSNVGTAARQLQVALSDQDTTAEGLEEDLKEVAQLDDGEEPIQTDDDLVVDAFDTTDAEGGEPELPQVVTEKEDRIQVFVGNLPFSATSEDVRSLFEEVNIPVLSISLPTNPTRVNEVTGLPSSKGFAFVSLEEEESIEKAIDALNEREYEGRFLRVNKLVPKDELEPRRNTKRDFGVEAGRKKLYLGNLPFDATNQDIQDYLGEYGTIYDVYIPMKDGQQRGFGFVTMDEKAANLAIRECDGAEFMGRRLTVNEPMNKSEKTERGKRQSQFKIYVGNVSFDTSKETLQGVFEEFGSVYDCFVPLDADTMRPRGFAFITMDRESGEEAIAELDGLELDGRFIRVNEAQGQKKTAPKYRNNRDDDEWYNNKGSDGDY